MLKFFCERPLVSLSVAVRDIHMVCDIIQQKLVPEAFKTRAALSINHTRVSSRCFSSIIFTQKPLDAAHGSERSMKAPSMSLTYWIRALHKHPLLLLYNVFEYMPTECLNVNDDSNNSCSLMTSTLIITGRTLKDCSSIAAVMCAWVELLLQNIFVMKHTLTWWFDGFFKYGNGLWTIITPCCFLPSFSTSLCLFFYCPLLEKQPPNHMLSNVNQRKIFD